MRLRRHIPTAALTAALATAIAAGGAGSATRPPTTDIRVTALAAPVSVRLGSPITVGFSVRNTSSVAAKAATLGVAVPSGVAVESVTSPGARCTPRACALGTVQPKVTRQIQVTIKPSAVGTWAVTARVSSSERPATGEQRLLRARRWATTRSDPLPIIPAQRPTVLVEVDAISPRGEDPRARSSRGIR
jgi:hypothetical protein